MPKRVFSTVMFILLLTSMLTLSFEIQTVKASERAGNPLVNLETTITDDFSTDSGMWIFVDSVVNIDTGVTHQGSAYRDTLNEYMVLTENVNYQAGVIWLNQDVFSSFTVELKYKAGGGTGADGLVFMFYKEKNYDPYDGGGLGFVTPPGGPSAPTAVSGYGIEFDNWLNGVHNDPSGNHIALIKDHVSNHLEYSDDPGTEDNQWHNVKIRVGYSSVEVSLDGDIEFTWEGEIDRTYRGLGFSAATASCNNWHIIDDVKITVDPCGRPVLTDPLIISSESSEVGYIVGATLNAEFTIRNDGDAAIKLDKLGVGGRFNEGSGTLPNGLFPDFTFQSVTLEPGEPHQYSGRLDLTEVGDYHFFVAYYIASPTEAEKTLLDPNNWNTYIDLASGRTDSDRIGSAQVIDLPLATRASMFAKAMIGANYKWGGNGWNWSNAGWGRQHGCKFISSQEIRSGQYLYYDPYTGKTIPGNGLDCSGLVYWAYNKAYLATNFAPKEGYVEVKTGTTTTAVIFPSNPIAFTGAHNQYKFNVQELDKTTSKADLLPGDLVFFDDDRLGYGVIDHVAMYVGDYSFAGGTIELIYYPPGTYDCVEAYDEAHGILPCVLETKEFTWTESGIPKTKTITGLKTRDGFERLDKPFGRVKSVNLSLKEAQDLEIIPKSPITLKVTDPRGFTVSENETEAPEMIYLKYDADEDGEPEDVVVVLNKILGDYIIEAIPKPDALPGDTYSLELSTNNSTMMLAQNVSISHIPPQPYIITSNGTAITPRLDPHDIGIRQLITSKTIVGQGFSLPVSVTIFNYGNFTETFNVTFYANASVIAIISNITVASRNTADIDFAWVTIGCTKGNYTINAFAEPVLGENYTEDNMRSSDQIVVTIPGDLNGDKTVDIFDAIILASHFEIDRYHPLWDSNIDINNDGIVDIFDAIVLAANYGKSWT